MRGSLESQTDRSYALPFRRRAALLSLAADRMAEDEIEALRRMRLSGPAIARRLARPVSTVGAVLRRRGLGRLRALDPRVPIVRYECEKPAN